MPLIIDGIEIPFDAIDNVTKVVDGVNASIVKMIEKEKQLAQNNVAIDKFNRMTQAEKDLFLQTQKTVEAQRQQEQAQKDLASSTSESTFSWTELSSAIGIAKQAYQIIDQVVEETFGTFQKYAGQVRDLSLITKTSAEDTSRLIQVMDDYELTAEDAEAATKRLKEKGLVPTVETIAMLADQYKQIKDPAEAMAFIQDNLGKGGAKWVNVLNQQSDALIEQAAAIDKNLILTDEQIAKAEKERLAVDALSDTWEGFKVQAGAAIGESILMINDQQKASELLFKAYQGGKIDYLELTDAQYKLNHQQVEATAIIERYQNVFTELQPVMEDYIAGEHEIYESNQDLAQSNDAVIVSMEAVKAGVQGVIGDAYDKYQETLSSLQEKHAQLEFELQAATVAYGANSEKVIELNDALAENEQKQTDAAAAMDEAINKMIYQQAAAGLDAEATLELARAMGVMDEESYAVASATEALHQQFLNGQLSATEYAAKVAELRDNVNSLKDKDITITVNTINNATSGANYNPYANYASGTRGWQTVPSGFPNDTYPIRLTSGEKFAVIPAPQAGHGYAGGTNWSGAGDMRDSRLDEKAIANAMVTALKQTGLI